jgi:pimeloyl-ACP methyl ester carboxylesterase
MTELHYTVTGKGFPVVLIHGLAGSTRWWRRNAPGLSRFFKVYLIDLPGIASMNGTNPVETLRACLPAWLDTLGLERVHLVGHSLGGYVAIHLAATQPERVARLALIDSVGIPIDARPHQMLARAVQGARHASWTFMPTIFRDGVRAGLPALWRLTEAILEVDARPLLREIVAPTLILWGTRDTVLPPKLGRRMAEMMQNATFQLVPRAGHNSMADNSRMVNRALLDFFLQEE